MNEINIDIEALKIITIGSATYVAKVAVADGMINLTDALPTNGANFVKTYVKQKNLGKLETVAAPATSTWTQKDLAEDESRAFRRMIEEMNIIKRDLTPKLETREFDNV